MPASYEGTFTRVRLNLVQRSRAIGGPKQAALPIQVASPDPGARAVGTEGDAARPARDRDGVALLLRRDVDHVDLRAVLGAHADPAPVGAEHRVLRVLAGRADG